MNLGLGGWKGETQTDALMICRQRHKRRKEKSVSYYCILFRILKTEKQKIETARTLYDLINNIESKLYVKMKLMSVKTVFLFTYAHRLSSSKDEILFFEISALTIFELLDGF